MEKVFARVSERLFKEIKPLELPNGYKDIPYEIPTKCDVENNSHSTDSMRETTDRKPTKEIVTRRKEKKAGTSFSSKISRMCTSQCQFQLVRNKISEKS